MFWKIVGVLTALATAIVLALLAWPQGFGLEHTPGFAHAVSLRLVAAIGAIVFALLFALIAIPKGARAWALTMMSLLLVFAIASTAIVGVRGFGGAPLGDEQEGELTVLTWNTLGGEPDAQLIVDTIVEFDADIVSLPETRSELGVEVSLLLRDLGTPFWVHTTWTDEHEVYGALSTSLLISAELGEYTTDLDIGQTLTVPTIVARPDDGEGPVLVAVHAVAPVPNQMANWRADLEFLAGLCDGSNVILAGDFNSTLDHWASLAEPGADFGQCSDAALATGAGGVGTWPTDVPAALGAPIDHIAVSEHWTPIATEVITSMDDAGSDHRVVVARIAPSGVSS